MNPFWPYIAGPTLAIVFGGILHGRRRTVFWVYCSILTLIPAAWFYQLNRDPSPPFNAPSVLTAVFVVVPMLATFGIERLWWMIGRSRPGLTSVASVPVGIITYAISTFGAMMAAVAVGVLDA